MARRAPKKQARRNGGGGIPGWIWLLIGLLVGALVVAVMLLRGQWDLPDGNLPTPNPEARAPAATEEEPVAQKPAAEPRKPKYEFFDVLRDKEFVIPDAELNAQAQAEASRPADAAVSSDLAWRVIGLLNVFRLLVPMVLILLLFFNAPNNSVGAVKPGLFLGICVAYFTFALVCIQPIQRRWPSAEWMALFPLAVDGLAIVLLIYRNRKSIDLDDLSELRG